MCVCVCVCVCGCEFLYLLICHNTICRCFDIEPRNCPPVTEINSELRAGTLSPSKPKSKQSTVSSVGQTSISKTPPTLHLSFTNGVTKYSTPLPKHVAPPPPMGASPKDQVSKTQNTPQNTLCSSCTNNGPEYEDIDRKIHHSLSQEENETSPELLTKGNEYTPPPCLPPKPGRELPGEKSLPPLPPRSTPIVKKKRHRYLTDPTMMEGNMNDQETGSKGAEATENTGIYEPVGPLEQNLDIEPEISYYCYALQKMTFIS